MNVSIRPDDIELFSDSFDRVWQESEAFKARALSELIREPNNFGTGRVFDLWSRAVE